MVSAFKKIAYENLVKATERAFEQLSRKEGPVIGTKEYWTAHLAYLDQYVSKNYPRLYNAYNLFFGDKFAELA